MPAPITQAQGETEVIDPESRGMDQETLALTAIVAQAMAWVIELVDIQEAETKFAYVDENGLLVGLSGRVFAATDRAEAEAMNIGWDLPWKLVSIPRSVPVRPMSDLDSAAGPRWKDTGWAEKQAKWPRQLLDSK